MYFDEELEFLSSNDFEKLSQDQLNDIIKRNPNVSPEYINFLSEIGAGNLNVNQFKIYADLVDFNDLGLEDIYQLPENVKLFGDNFSGDFAGFDLTTKNNLVVEFWHDDNKVVNTGKTFREYIREKLSMNT